MSSQILRRLAACAAALAAAALAPSPARAQGIVTPVVGGAPPDPNAPAAYPRQEVARPLLLPGGVEGQAFLQTFDDEGADFGDYLPLDLFARWGRGDLELFGGMRFLTKQPERSDVETLRQLRAGAAYAVGQELAVRADARMDDPQGAATTYRLRGTGEFRRRIDDQLAAIGYGGLELVNPVPEPEPPDVIYDVLLFVRGDGIYQVTEELSLRASGTVWFPIASGPEERDPTTRVDLAARGLFNAAPSFDVFFEVELERATDEGDEAVGDPDETQTLVRIGGLLRI